jgi:hypothetical protein
VDETSRSEGLFPSEGRQDVRLAMALANRLAGALDLQFGAVEIIVDAGKVTAMHLRQRIDGRDAWRLELRDLTDQGSDPRTAD